MATKHIVQSEGANGHDGKIVGATWVKQVADGKYVSYHVARRAAEWVLETKGLVIIARRSRNQ